MNLEELRDEAYASSAWKRVTPFFARLSPAFLYDHVRSWVVGQAEREITTTDASQDQVITYFSYPSESNLEEIHEAFHQEGLFMSELLELVGYHAAEALATLAAFIRFESDSASLRLLRECFEKLWNTFSASHYSRGYRTSQVRANLVMTLGANNVFGIVGDHSWTAFMAKYFEEEYHPWTGEPLSDSYRHILKILGRSVSSDADNDVILRGVFPLDTIPDDKIPGLCNGLYWEKGGLEDDLPMPPIMLSTQRRGRAQPTSDIYYMPLHLVRVTCKRFWSLPVSTLATPFQKAAMHFFLSLDLRSKIVSATGTAKSFTLQQAAGMCGGSLNAARMALGHLLQCGLAEFDKSRQEPWYGANQEFVCTEQASGIAYPPDDSA